MGSIIDYLRECAWCFLGEVSVLRASAHVYNIICFVDFGVRQTADLRYRKLQRVGDLSGRVSDAFQVDLMQRASLKAEYSFHT